jgi:hypothetical protein
VILEREHLYVPRTEHLQLLDVVVPPLPRVISIGGAILNAVLIERERAAARADDMAGLHRQLIRPLGDRGRGGHGRGQRNHRQQFSIHDAFLYSARASAGFTSLYHFHNVKITG